MLAFWARTKWGWFEALKKEGLEDEFLEQLKHFLGDRPLHVGRRDASLRSGTFKFVLQASDFFLDAFVDGFLLLFLVVSLAQRVEIVVD